MRSASFHNPRRAYRERGAGRGRWLVDVPVEAAFHLCRTDGSSLLDPATGDPT
jgi:hypothetical protein